MYVRVKTKNAPGGGRGRCGARLARLLGGGNKMRWLLVTNYMIDIRWLVSAVPAILDAEEVVIVHGERSNNTRWGVLGFASASPMQPNAADSASSMKRMVWLAAMSTALELCRNG
jgi:hypothetical protein